jgi:hypothetical protein
MGFMKMYFQLLSFGVIQFLIFRKLIKNDEKLKTNTF